MSVRRVVTGHDACGKSVFVSDDTVAPDEPLLLPGAEFHRLWGGDETPRFPDDGAMPPGDAAPSTDIDFDFEAAVADAEAKLPGLLGYLDPSDPGMHTTDTIDFEVVLDGTVMLELDDGAEVTLHPGDTVVQNGTRHRWKNPGPGSARLAVFICGAEHSGIRPAE